MIKDCSKNVLFSMGCSPSTQHTGILGEVWEKGDPTLQIWTSGLVVSEDTVGTLPSTGGLAFQLKNKSAL